MSTSSLPFPHDTDPKGSGDRQSSLTFNAPRIRELDLYDREFFIPIHGFVKFNDAEKAIIDHPALQRLKTIYQLGQAYTVYPGATHKRFEHVLGVVCLAQRIIDAVNENHREIHERREFDERLGHKCETWGEPIGRVERAFIRLTALLHDIGHLSAGHTLEDELHFLDRHDEIPRLRLIFNRGIWKGERAMQTLGELIDEKYGPLVPDELKKLGLRPRDVVEELIVKADDSRTIEDTRQGRGVLRPRQTILAEPAAAPF